MIDNSFTMFETDLVQHPTSMDTNPRQKKEASAFCPNCCRRNPGRTVSTQFPSSKRIESSKESLIWSSEELTLLRKDLSHTREEKLKYKIACDLKDADLEKAETRFSALRDENVELSEKLSSLTKQLSVCETERSHLQKEQNVLSVNTRECLESLKEAKEAQLNADATISQLKAVLRGELQAKEKLLRKLEKSDERLRKCLQFQETKLIADFDRERNEMQHMIDKLTVELETERNNHLLSSKALEQLQLHFSHHPNTLSKNKETDLMPKINLL